ncbi:hypothetical protein OT109_04820 [Phycisphaeraceae bacterium D3-23]
MLTIPLRPLLTLAGFLALLLTLLASTGCVSVRASETHYASAETAAPPRSAADLERDRAAILGMAGEFTVAFDFKETLALRPGYELTEPYHAEATELVVVVDDQPEHIEMQHILVVWHEGEGHIVKHWRQVWQYEQTERFEFVGHNTWQPTTISDTQAQGTWTQSVFQVSDEPRYWGTGTWVHAHGVSTWTSDTTHRPLPRREDSKRSDYHIVVATNTHIVTDAGWVHQQDNAKLDLDNPDHPVIALEQGVNTYTRTDQVDFATAYDYWDHTHTYWLSVRAAWNDLLESRETIALQKQWRGDPMYNHLFDLADEYWGDNECADAQARAAAVINAFTTEPAAAE